MGLITVQRYSALPVIRHNTAYIVAGSDARLIIRGPAFTKALTTLDFRLHCMAKLTDSKTTIKQ